MWAMISAPLFDAIPGKANKHLGRGGATGAFELNGFVTDVPFAVTRDPNGRMSAGWGSGKVGGYGLR